jgi:hypothetical protein
MISPAEIVGKLERQYASVLQASVRGETVFPLTLPVGQIPKKDFLQLRQSIEALKAGSKEVLGYGYGIEFESVNVRGADRQTLPTRIVVDTQADYLRLLKRKREFDDFIKDVDLIRARLPDLTTWIEANPLQVIKYHGKWAQLLMVCEYFQAQPRPYLYIRELPIPVHTKFIEEYEGILRDLLDITLPAHAVDTTERHFERRYGLRYDEPLIRFRILDPELLSHYHLPFADVSVPLSAFITFDLSGRASIIVENKMSFLTLPPTRNAFAIFGSGFKVEGLASVPWLAHCPIYYWGDLDAQGFQILSLLRSTFPHVSSVMMDEQTLVLFSERVREGKATSITRLPFLSVVEHTVYEKLVQHNWRLEQEQIDYRYVMEQLEIAFK